MKKNAAFEEKSGILFLKNVHFLIFTFRFSGREISQNIFTVNKRVYYLTAGPAFGFIR